MGRTRRDILSGVTAGLTLLSGCSTVDDIARPAGRALDDAAQGLSDNGGSNNETPEPVLHKKHTTYLQHGDVSDVQFSAEAGSTLKIKNAFIYGTYVFKQDDFPRVKRNYESTGTVDMEDDIDITYSSGSLPTADLPADADYVIMMVNEKLGEGTPTPRTVEIEYWLYE